MVRVNRNDLTVTTENGTYDMDQLLEIAKRYHALATYEYLKECYSNNDDTLWTIAVNVYDEQHEAEANGHPITEGEAIELITINLNITLEQEN